MAPAFLRSPEKAILDGVREHAIDHQGTMHTTTDAEREDERAHCRRDALLLTVTGPLVTLVLLAAWAATGAGYFWPVWPMLGMSIAVLVALYRAFGPLPQTAAGARESRAPEPM
jgi:hypothetical protein